MSEQLHLLWMESIDRGKKLKKQVTHKYMTTKKTACGISLNSELRDRKVSSFWEHVDCGSCLRHRKNMSSKVVEEDLQ